MARRVMLSCLEGGFIVLVPAQAEHDQHFCEACGVCLACNGSRWCSQNPRGVHQWTFTPKEGKSPEGKKCFRPNVDSGT